MAPGPLSRVVTPFRLSAVLVPGAAGRVHAALLGEDGRLLASTTEQFANRSGQRINFLTELDFEIEAVAETGTLTVSVDDRFGRTTDLASVEIILLAEGQSDINPPGDLLAPIVLLEPAAGSLASGGELMVTGLARPGSDGPLLLELITQDGTVVGARLAAVDPGPPGEHRPFLAIIPYTVSDTTQALLVVRERSDRFSGATQILSREVVLSP